jgi:hypothetical protein
MIEVGNTFPADALSIVEVRELLVGRCKAHVEQ